MSKVILPQLEDAVRQQNQAIHADMTTTAMMIYANMVGSFILASGVDGPHSMPEKLRHFAACALKSAPYLAEARGFVKVDDATTWGLKKGIDQC